MTKVSFLDKETICEDLTKQRGLCLGQQTNEEATKPVYTAFLALNSLTLVIRMLFIFLVWGGHLYTGDLFPAFGGKRGVRCFGFCFFLISFFSPQALYQVTLVQNNQYDIEAYLGAACPGTQQRL